MKKCFFIFCGAFFFISCNLGKDKTRKDRIIDDNEQSQLEMAKTDTTSVLVIDSLYNFGTIKEGDLVEHNFRFINTGHKPLVFPEEPIASCGCTVPKRPEKPVLPGDTSFIKVVFNSKGKSDHVVKTVTVISNAYPSFPKLILTGDIQKSE
jgi:hypothetical protein